MKGWASGAISIGCKGDCPLLPPHLALETFIRIREMARMRLGSGETKGLVLSEH